MKKTATIIICVTMLAGCAVMTGIKKKFCSMDFNTLQSNISSDLAYVNSRYDTYVNMLKGGKLEAKDWVVAADLFLAAAKPILIGLQQGICQAELETAVQNALATANAAKVAEIVMQGQEALAKDGLK